MQTPPKPAPIAPEFLFQPVTRENVQLKILLSSVSGGGKTLSALFLAYGLLSKDDKDTEVWDKICFLDTEKRTGTYYHKVTYLPSDGVPIQVGQYKWASFAPPYSPARWMQAIRAALAQNPGVLIIDNLADVWVGDAGILDYQTSLGGRVQDWNPAGAKLDEILDLIHDASCPVICTLMEKPKHEMCETIEENGRIKKEVRKLGLQPQIRAGSERNFSVHLSIDHQTHKAQVGIGKDRTGLFSLKEPEQLNPSTGRALRAWAESATEPVGSRGWIASQALALDRCQTADEFNTVYKTARNLSQGLIPVDLMKPILDAFARGKARLAPTKTP